MSLCGWMSDTEGEDCEIIREGEEGGWGVKVSQQLNLQKMPNGVEWEEVFYAIRRE